MDSVYPFKFQYIVIYKFRLNEFPSTKKEKKVFRHVQVFVIVVVIAALLLLLIILSKRNTNSRTFFFSISQIRLSMSLLSTQIATVKTVT